jgi:hypothetical protein
MGTDRPAVLARPPAPIPRIGSPGQATDTTEEGTDPMAQHDDETTGGQDGPSPSELIDGRIAELGDWRGELLARIREVVHRADPDVVEEWKWRGVPTWSHDGILLTGETYKKQLKMTFAKGASLPDPTGIFNSSLDGNVRRAIDLFEGDELDEDALAALVRAAVELNAAKPSRRR